MKKLLFVAILGTLVACGETSTETTSTDTSTVTDTTIGTVESDTAIIVDSSAAVKDTTTIHSD
ncbi:MAG: hypothetical protein V4717_05075 [Bacteroidota bacterium]